MRQVSLLIGRQSYSMKTSLSDAELKDAQAVVNDALKDTGDFTSDQEIRLAVACMVLANRLASAGKRIDNILSQEEEGMR
ncbi:MAG: hypothetical protein LBQ36_00175 [Synergistaceae bacterium]|jgi:hypothetical protein|nr:hypothetical protein [Synergistaceae bacterium]